MIDHDVGFDQLHFLNFDFVELAQGKLLQLLTHYLVPVDHHLFLLLGLVNNDVPRVFIVFEFRKELISFDAEHVG